MSYKYNRKTVKGQRLKRVRQSNNRFYVNDPEDQAAQILDSFGHSFSKRGYPDLTVYNEDGSIYGFVEVKPEEDRELKKEQKVFEEFCRSRNIPFVRWSPDEGKEKIEGFLRQGGEVRAPNP